MPTDGLININGDSVQSLEIIALTTLIALMPSLLVMMTSFTRYIISLSFLRTAMGTNQTPPNVVLVGIAIFLTLITMNPTLSTIKEEALDPYPHPDRGGGALHQRGDRGGGICGPGGGAAEGLHDCQHQVGHPGDVL